MSDVVLDHAVAAPASRSREDWRRTLFALIDDAAAQLEADEPLSETLRHLPPATMRFLRSPDLLRLKMPRSLGGADADNALQFEVFERIAYHSAAASWVCFIYADQIGLLGALLSDEGLAALTRNGLPLVCGGGGRLLGDLQPVEGGYRLSGQWIYGSGITGSDWVGVLAMDRTRPDAPEVMFVTVPTASVQAADNWNALGLRGTGSVDFEARSVFVPDAMVIRFDRKPLRGPASRLGTAGFIAHTVPATILGIARRVLDDLAAGAGARERGYGSRQSLGGRAVFQAFLGEADLRLRAARALMLENGLRLTAELESGRDTTAIEVEARAAGTYVASVATAVVTDAIRFAGGEAVKQGSRLERALRDITTASTHYCINNTAYEAHARSIMGLGTADPDA